MFKNIIKTYPQTGKFKGFRTRPLLAKLLFPFLGLAALLWFLLRVLPKPSRASYPCMKAAAPLASSFVVWAAGMMTSAAFFHKAKKHFKASRYLPALALIITALFINAVSINPKTPVFANSAVVADEPLGQGVGIFPGRVVWDWNPDATNENWVNKMGDAYYMPKNSNLAVIDDMVTHAILRLTEKPTVKEAWKALFANFNERKGKGAVGYAAGEKIFIKINSVGSNVDSKYKIGKLHNYNMSRTSPQPVLIILRHLINDCGIAQENISVGDPMKDISQIVFDVWHDEFPDVKYICHHGGGGRTKSVAGTKTSIYYSDHGTVLREGTWDDASAGAKVYSDKFYTVIEEADYMITIPALKAHARAGVTLTAKIHFGSHTRSAAKHLHMGLVSPDMKTPFRTDYKMYRVQVDLMGHKLLGGNTMLFLIDGLWGGSEANDPPCKFMMPPFNGDWPSSIFVSQDQVAVESVCFDFLKGEFTKDNPIASWPQMPAADDYMRQAADPAQWPEGLVYDPEKDGTPIGSLGVHEHWNNPVDKQYSIDLGGKKGIELIRIDKATTRVQQGTRQPVRFQLEQNWPNPFNPDTHITYELADDGAVALSVYDINGRRVRMLEAGPRSRGLHQAAWDGRLDDETNAPSGVYFYQLVYENGRTKSQQTRRMTLIR